MPNLQSISKGSKEPFEVNSVSSASSTEISFDDFLAQFPLQGEQLYIGLFDRHTDVIQTQKAKYAVANLEKIFRATFEISSVSGFDRMSLRDLSKRTGMSMGAIYSCITKKEDIALMVAGVVRSSSELTREQGQQAGSALNQLKMGVRYHLFASTLLQPWYFFLYFETRSLPERQQAESKQIELDGISSFKALIERGVENGEFHCEDIDMVANTIVVLLEDWYLKPWKTQMFGLDTLSQRNPSQRNPSQTNLSEHIRSNSKNAEGDQEYSDQRNTGHKNAFHESNIERYYQSVIRLIQNLLAV